MATTTKEKEVVTVPAAITSKFNIALMQTGFQSLATKVSSLEFNEDNIDVISEVLKTGRNIKKCINDTFETGKAPSLAECKTWDLAKNTFLETLDIALGDTAKKHHDLCLEAERKKALAAQERVRIENIKIGIENNKVRFANMIANAETSEQITYIEKLINLEKGNNNKYMEFLPEAALGFGSLNTKVAEQKLLAKEKEVLAAKLKEADEKGDDQAFLDLEEKKESLDAEISQNKILIQEDVLSAEPISDITPHEEILPSVSARRTTWKYEIENKEVAVKKSLALLDIEINSKAAKAFLETLKDIGKFEGQKKIVIGGIKFWESKIF